MWQKPTVAHKGHYALFHNTFRIIEYAFQIMCNIFQLPLHTFWIHYKFWNLHNTFQNLRNRFRNLCNTFAQVLAEKRDLLRSSFFFLRRHLWSTCRQQLQESFFCRKRRPWKLRRWQPEKWCYWNILFGWFWERNHSITEHFSNRNVIICGVSFSAISRAR